MKYAILLLCLMFVSIQANNAVIDRNSVSVYINEEAYFQFSADYLRSLEANYCWFKEDFGGETYAGITRRWFPEWTGWAAIDAQKNSNEPLPWNVIVEDAEPKVDSLYRQWWKTYHVGVINDSLSAAYTFETLIGGSPSVKVLQKTLNELADTVRFPVDGVPTRDMMEFISTIPSKVYVETLRLNRYAFYKRAANRSYMVVEDGVKIYKKTQRMFLKGWLRRANKMNLLYGELLSGIDS